MLWRKTYIFGLCLVFSKLFSFLLKGSKAAADSSGTRVSCHWSRVTHWGTLFTQIYHKSKSDKQRHRQKFSPGQCWLKTQKEKTTKTSWNLKTNTLAPDTTIACVCFTGVWKSESELIAQRAPPVAWEVLNDTTWYLFEWLLNRDKAVKR